jgi:hypothetical protein
MLVLVLLGVVWVAALAPMVLRKLRERETVSSVTSFNRHLVRLSAGTVRSGNEGSVPGAAIGFSAAARRLAEQRGLAGLGDAGAIRFGARSAGGSSAVAGATEIGPLVSHATTIRRRRVVAVLGLGTVLSFALGFGVSLFFYVALMGLIALLAYLGLLAYFHQLALERAQKVVALETRRGVAMALDEARMHGGIPVAPRPKVGGSGWKVPDEELEGLDLVRGELISASSGR